MHPLVASLRTKTFIPHFVGLAFICDQIWKNQSYHHFSKFHFYLKRIAHDVNKDLTKFQQSVHLYAGVIALNRVSLLCMKVRKYLFILYHILSNINQNKSDDISMTNHHQLLYL